MQRENTFTFRINAKERYLISLLADYLNRSKSDAVRFIIREAVNGLGIQKDTKKKTRCKNEN